MHDFRCSNANYMYFKQMADRTRYFKETEKGVIELSKIVEEMFKEWAETYVQERAEERAQEEAEQIAVKMLKMDFTSKENIAEITSLSLEKVMELAEKVKAATA